MDTTEAGRKGGIARSKQKAAAARRNGKKGGKPPMVFTAEHLETGEVVEMRRAQVMAIITETLPHYPECWNMSALEITKLARANISGLKSGVSPDISFGDYKFTIKTV